MRHIRNSGEIAPVRGMPIFDRYDFTIEAEVPIGVEPQYIYQQNLIRMTDRAYDYWLKRGTLKLGLQSGPVLRARKIERVLTGLCERLDELYG